MTYIKKGYHPYNKGKRLTHLWGNKNKLWKGGSLNKRGYMCICVGGRKIYLHRYVMECFLGRKLKKWEIVHHIDGNKSNNNLENLEVMVSANHRRFHLKDTLQKKGRYFNRWEGIWVS